ncbi:hypothetical protein [Tolumonas lignilytica]|uniref:hypothetical protein n=1 Tax=Tolumonas lignilytica TaxID=1283284 RepID=UPI0004B98037|nr:hypothetical protein [Tolumonas lignilytica]
MIEIGNVGLIEAGDDIGYQVKIVDDSENTGGFLILISKDFNNSDSEAFDDWVANEEELACYFEESNWIIKWF